MKRTEKKQTQKSRQKHWSAFDSVNLILMILLGVVTLFPCLTVVSKAVSDPKYVVAGTVGIFPYLYDLITMATSMRDASGNLSGGLESLEVVASDNIRSATIVVSTVPILILYPFLQKYFVKGVTVGSVKG